MTILAIPLSPQPQMFRIKLGTATYQMTFRYRNWDCAGWMMDIADVNGNLLACGLPVVTGLDLMEQLKYLGLPGQYFVLTMDGDWTRNPGFTDLGNPTVLWWVS